MVDWFVVSLLAGMANLLYEFTSRKFLRAGDPLNYTWWFSLIRSGVTLVALLVVPTGKLTHTDLLWLIVLGLGNFANLFLFMKMHAVTELSISTILTRLRLVWVPLIAFLLVGEHLDKHGMTGIALLLIASLLVIAPKHTRISSGAGFALTFSITTALLTVLIKRVSLFASPILTLFAMSAPTTLLVPLIHKNSLDGLLTNWRAEFFKRGFLALLSMTLIYLMIVALNLGGSVSKVNAVILTTSVFAAPAGILFLKENKDVVHKLLGAALALLGIFLLVY